MNRNFTARAITAVLPMILLTACVSNGAQTSLPANSVISPADADVPVTVPDGNESSTQSTAYDDSDNKRESSDNDVSNDYQREQRIRKYATDSPITVYETTLRNGDSEYDCIV